MKKTTIFHRFLGFVIFIIILAIPTLLCGFAVNFRAAFQMWAFMLAFLVPMFGGTLIVYKYFWKNQRLAFFLEAVVLGATFFLTSFVGMTMDGRISSWRQVLSLSAIIGVIGFIVVIVITPFYTFLVRNIFKTR